MSSVLALRKRILNGLKVNAFGHVVTIIIQFISLPVFLHFWGLRLYGEWLILASIPTYLTFSDVGFSNAAANEMTMRVANGNKLEAQRVFESAWALVSLISLTILLLACFVFYFIPLSSWLNIHILERNTVVEILFILAIYVVIGLQNNFFQTGFRAEGKYAEGMWYANILRLFEFLSVIVTLFFNGAPVQIATVYLLSRIVGTLVIGSMMFKKVSWLKFSFHNFSRTIVKSLLKPSISFMGLPVGNALSLEGIILVIGVTIGPAAVVAFSAMRTLSRSVVQVIAMINSAVWPEFSISFGKGNVELAKLLHRRSCKATIWLSLSMAMVLFVVGDWLVHIWTHGKVQIDHIVFSILLIVVVLNSFWHTSSVVLNSCNKHIKYSQLYLFGTSLSVLGAYYFSTHYGLLGAASALLIIDFIMITYVVPSSLHLVNDSFLGFVKYLSAPTFSDFLSRKVPNA